ncbi:hypothetical protein [Rubricoccus marinus]|uniref:Uncharacterized protein n=1 Tax=Rubricoccus marinus TaxID=716817 RepID=A0A259TXH1_9BACT|nr:hypothetical protein [Rubricoccus marinus]OZC02396.1 hypothetical protein BSZ36_05050 [Rubricoccus marinus]
MHTPHPQAEPRLRETVPTAILRLRRSSREVIPPEACRLGPDCVVCRWRREGLLDGAETPGGPENLPARSRRRSASGGPAEGL